VCYVRVCVCVFVYVSAREIVLFVVVHFEV